ncbi:MAG: ADP-forming succinate--CoA ligase subunit beta [Methylacidiphilales bacterium]|nr:ADP-forming succinate--CoA ligase subunit beta [Candidatus Methylacidiphilales bacterium]MDW8349217.1 ADP-forming succinate--CoA ligase subunit beta [Verrucomicrobiae bacterium]
MNIHEYQARELLQRFKVPTPQGRVARTPQEARTIAESLLPSPLVVKAQIHAGGRGKGTFTNGLKGGVHLCSTPDEVAEITERMIGHTLVTAQTGPSGRLVRQVLVAEASPIERELYAALLIDRSQAAPIFIVSPRGGMDIEKVAHETPEAITRLTIDPLEGLHSYQARTLALALGLRGKQLTAAAQLLSALYNLFIQCDCSLLEINPLAVTPQGQVLALDAKINFDDNALYRHPEILALRDPHEEDPRDVEASKFHLNYIGLDGNIGCMVNGAGLAMATMDIIQYYGGRPANFLDVGGGANEEQVTEAFRILCSDKNVQAILVNIFGGIMKCDIIAQGILNAAKIVKLNVPLVVRLEGTNVQRGKELLQNSGLPIITADTLSDAAQKVVASVK